MKTKDNLKLIKNYLPFSLRAIAEKLPYDTQEIRLRVNRPVAVYTPFKTLFVTNVLTLSEDNNNLLILSPRELSETFATICNYSVYSKQNEIINGFITLKGGNRAGICGTSIVNDGKIINIRDITSINIRVCEERLNCGENLLAKLDDIRGGVLLCGAPCSGKTTILRDIARTVSYKYKTALVDSRSELAAVYGGVPQNDISLCDVLDGYSKRDGFSHALRCLSPELIICDELGGEEDCRCVLDAQKSGVAVIASAHCRDSSQLQKKPLLYSLIKSRCFETVVFLGDGRNVGQIREIVNADELL